MTTEADTCRRLVTPKLYAAGWTDEQICEQVYSPGRIIVVGERAARVPAKKVDYLLRYEPHLPIAVLEAKKSSESVAKGIQQAKEYAIRYGVRFAYASNGHDIVEIDMNLGIETRRDAFPSPSALWAQLCEADELPDAVQRGLLQPAFRDPARPPRYYQEIAINRIVAAVVGGRSRVLVTMATGCGKTTVSFQACWRLWNLRWNRKGQNRPPRILFLADRTLLVDDPYSREFSAFEEARHRIQGDVNLGREMYFATYQTFASGNRTPPLFQEYPRDFFDLVVIDECHRGSADEEGSWRAILDWFSGATHLGMTATPKHEANADTYNYFGDPIYSYSLAVGIDDGFLAPYRVHRIVTSADLDGFIPRPGEKDVHGQPIPHRAYGTPEFERLLAHEARTKAIAQHLTDHLRKTDRFAKTIVFCVDQEHADDMRREISNLNADLVAQHPDYVCRVTDEEGDIGRAHLSHFQDVELRTPTILTTSKMLTTGVDAPTVKNIAIVRSIGSIVEFKQIIGRGTRVREDYGKLFFTILDYTGSAVQLFADPAFDGVPVVNAVAKVDANGAVTREVIEEDPALEPLAKEAGLLETQPVLPPPDPRQPRRKLRVKGGQVVIDFEVIYRLGDDDRLMVRESISEYTTNAVRSLRLDEARLRSEWQDQARRQDVLNELQERGIDLALLARATGGDASQADPLDLLLHLAFGRPMLTRTARAARVKAEHRKFFEEFRPEARTILEKLLDSYARYGVNQLENAETFRAPPLSEEGTLIEIAGRFGGPDRMFGAIEELKRLIYAA